MIKIMASADIHQKNRKWHYVVKSAVKERPDFIILAGDILPKSDFKGQQRFIFEDLPEYLRDLRAVVGNRTLLYLGNDDCHVFDGQLDEYERQGLCVNMRQRVYREEGLVFAGMNMVRDYPFGYKHWVTRDDPYVKCPVQFCGEGLEISDDGNYIRLEDLRKYLEGKPSISDNLVNLRKQMSDDEFKKSVWIVHQPPAGLGMDICNSGDMVGSSSVNSIIDKNGPLLGISGHIHESPYKENGRWFGIVEKTLWVQAGQLFNRLHYAVIEIGPDFLVKSYRHSIFK